MFVECIEQVFRFDEILRFKWPSFLPNLEKEVADPFFAQAIAALFTKLASVPCILSAGGAWTVPSKLHLPDATSECFGKMPSEMLLKLTGKDFVHPAVGCSLPPCPLHGTT